MCRSHHCATVVCYTMFPYNVVHLGHFSAEADRKSDRSRRLIAVGGTSAHQDSSLAMVPIDSAIRNSPARPLSMILEQRKK